MRHYSDSLVDRGGEIGADSFVLVSQRLEEPKESARPLSEDGHLFVGINPGGVLLSHTVSHAVPSAP